jgi:hypothetical protein
VPWPPSKRTCVSSDGSANGCIRLGAAMHSESYSMVVGSRGIYLGSCETSVCLLMCVPRWIVGDLTRPGGCEVSYRRRSLPYIVRSSESLVRPVLFVGVIPHPL